MIKSALNKVVSGENLTRTEMEGAMNQIMGGKATPAQIGGFITGLRMKGETVDEIAGAAAIMREKATKIDPKVANGKVVIDTCGTGGDGQNTFNISTAAALVAAGAGAIVAKHGNRSVSSLCGSADVLEALGVNIDLEPKDVERCIEEVGIGFLFAPKLHGAMKHAIGPRKELGIRTIFNILGPLTNPAGAKSQLLGVYDPNLVEVLAKVLKALGSERAMVVNGGGTDELTTTGTSSVSYLNNGEIENFTIKPEKFGIANASMEDLKGGNIAENARIIVNILNGESSPRRDIVLLNSAASLVVAGLAPDIEAGLEMAADSIDSGKAKEKLGELKKFTTAKG
jgi:anthranilate phosphoribosyltransferase